ncbi:MAG: choice-of-anchor tandem repeat GloVer-containing protein [Candidatus Korobacteraceae bacterium]
MHKRQQFPNLIFGASLRPEDAALAIMLLLPFLIFVMLFMTLTAQTAQAQTYKVIYTFTGGADGATPYAGVTLDKAGNLYGTAFFGGDLACDAPNGCGTVYKLTHKGSGWTFNPLYSFAGGSDGAGSSARVIFGPHGTLYSTTWMGGTGTNCSYGGGATSCGTVFNLRPFPSVCKTGLCPWMETVLYDLTGYPNDGGLPFFGDLLFDQAGNAYGTTYEGGGSDLCGGDGCGTVYQLTPSGSGWTEGVLHSFTGPPDGENPYSGVIFDQAGKLYGTTSSGGTGGGGVVYQLTPSESGWTEKVLYNFQGGPDGAAPIAGLIFDQSGNLYGATFSGGGNGGGTVFKLTPSGGTWTYSALYYLSGPPARVCGPEGTLVMDGAGNLYGTTLCDGIYSFGSVFKLTPSGGSWSYTSLHDFTNGSDGRYPYSNVAFDANGNLYGTASAGGSQGFGVVWQITP